MYLAIDFGTSNTKAALVIEEKLILVRDSFQPESSFFPSSVYLTPEGQILVGHAADAMRDTDVRRYRKEFKRNFGEDVPYQLGDRQLLPQDLVSAVLSKVKQEAEIIAQSYGENSLTKVVLTVPASYNGYKKRLMQKVAEGVGFTEVQLLPEPEAAAYYYNRNNIISNGDIVLVYDLGGGTFDAALLRKEGEGYKSLVPPTGIDGCGGIDFDRQIYRRIRGQIKDSLLVERLGTFNDVKAQQDREILGDFCRGFKHQLSQVPRAFGRLILDREMYELTQEDFNLMIESVIDETVTECLGLVKDANLKVDGLNHVLLIGGSCRIPYVRKLLEARLTMPLFHLREPELAVCQGAVLFASETTVNQVVKTTRDGKSKSNQFGGTNMNKIKTNVKTKIIGFDLGHGETALHWTWDSGTDSSGKLPETLIVKGQSESFITAIAYDEKEKEIIKIGEAALNDSKSYAVDICFKARPEKEGTKKQIKDYVKYIYDNLVGTKSINPNQDHQILFYIGHPSGWEKESVDLYQEIMAKVLPNVKVAPESRAGLMTVIKTDQVTLKDLGKSVLVIDIGSSTTDFTLVGNQLNEPFEEAGADLGGALIDEAIYEQSLEKLQQELYSAKKEAKQRLEEKKKKLNEAKKQEVELEKILKDETDEKRLQIMEIFNSKSEGEKEDTEKEVEKETRKIQEIEEIEKIFAPESNHQSKSTAKFKCRQLKERYFSGGYLGGFGLVVKGRFTFEPIKDKNQLKKIINQKFEELERKTWAEAFRQKLENVKNKLNSKNREPGALFLTGGASRMGFIQDICEELFPNTKFVRDTKPEICISRGLALWGKTDYKVTGFLEEVESILEKNLSGLIQDNISSLFERLSGVLSDEVLYNIVKPSMLDWKNNNIRTLRGMEEKIIQDSKKWLDGKEARKIISDIVKDWSNEKVVKGINTKISKVYREYNLPENSLDCIVNMGIDPRIYNPVMRMESITQSLIYAIGVVGAFAIAVAPIIGLLILTLTVVVGQKNTTDWLKEADIFSWLRPTLLDSKKINEILTDNKPKIKYAIQKSLESESEVVNKIVEETKNSVRELIQKQAEIAKLLIL
ncbi:MAG: Hsp70 family protein [Cyanobacteria bacterium P01_H01_bin.35]